MSNNYTSETRDFVTMNRHGVLSTYSRGSKGYPFGSIVSYDITETAQIVIYISLIAEHYKNLVQDPRASLCIFDPFGVHDPQSHARATILTSFEVVPDSERQSVQALYESRFPSAVNYEIAHNFVFMRGTPERIRWIGGFGEIGWVEGSDFTAAKPDILAYSGMDVIKHMNEDHKEALGDFVKAFSSLDPDEYGIQMTGIHAGGFTINLAKQANSHTLEIQFPKMITSAEEVRGTIIALLKEAREKIGQDN